jgi:hypothetical protein
VGAAPPFGAPEEPIEPPLELPPDFPPELPPLPTLPPVFGLPPVAASSPELDEQAETPRIGAETASGRLHFAMRFSKRARPSRSLMHA